MNRRPKAWRERKEITGADGGAIAVTFAELVSRAAEDGQAHGGDAA